MEGREYTVEEANALLPELARALHAIRQARQEVLSGARHLRRWAPTNGGGLGQAYWDAMTVLRREVEELNAQSIVLRDPERGLVDFPSRREGRPVFLCWLLGEDRVGYWHDQETGFAGRRPL